jgi:hypothetical protein
LGFPKAALRGFPYARPGGNACRLHVRFGYESRPARFVSACRRSAESELTHRGKVSGSLNHLVAAAGALKARKLPR